MSTPTRANGGLLRLPPGDLTQLTGEQFDDLILSCLEETGTSRQLWSSFLGWARANKHDPERLSRLPTMKKCSRVYSPSPATDRAVSRWLRVRPAQVEPHYPLPVDLPTDTTLDAVRTIPYGDGASIYPAHLHTWPQGSEAATNEQFCLCLSPYSPRQ
ncbi:hypothetical protein BC832DRAFT_363626 [Gaertneriomyces semiglobifer]|nr:hypothetical protein BC832DRAFT_363626 [Gaertneriomyces semiglobifer]